MTRLLRSILRILLALLLGLGPLGASVLAESLHAPLCGCTGCAPSAEDVASCCGGAGEQEDGPVLVADASDCPCELVRPDRGSVPALAPRACESRGGLRGALERAQRAVELVPSPSRPPPAVPARAVRFRRGASGPPGPDGALDGRFGARAAALGALRI